MRKTWRLIREKLHIPSGQALVHLVLFEAISQFLWWLAGLLFSAIPEVAKGWGFLIIFVAGMFAVAWYLPKLSPSLYNLGARRMTNSVRSIPQLKHDGVLWEDRGNDHNGYTHVEGPMPQRLYSISCKV
jgi:hypothetical protein